jgi:hypothetical protein
MSGATRARAIESLSAEFVVGHVDLKRLDVTRGGIPYHDRLRVR